EKIAKEHDYNLNISRYVSTALPEPIIDLGIVNSDLVELEKKIKESTKKHNKFLDELGLPPLP
nr:SAM-dependent DNA methyltransferase [Chloroflexota bacterium]